MDTKFHFKENWHMSTIENEIVETTEMENEVNATVESAEEKTAEPAKVKMHWKNFSSPKFAKVKDILKKIRKWLLLAVAAICILVVALIGLNYATNNYKTPIKTIEKYVNAKEYTLEKMTIDYDGGLAKKQTKQIFKVLRNSDLFLDLEEKIYDNSISNYEKKLDKYGDDFKITYTILGYDELTKKDLRTARAALQDYVYEIEAIVDETEEFTASDWGEAAEEIGLLKAEFKELIKAFSELAKEYGRIEVSKGYEVSVLITTSGSELEEPKEDEVEIKVFKVNGRWISASNFRNVVDILSEID